MTLPSSIQNFQTPYFFGLAQVWRQSPLQTAPNSTGMCFHFAKILSAFWYHLVFILLLVLLCLRRRLCPYLDRRRWRRYALLCTRIWWAFSWSLTGICSLFFCALCENCPSLSILIISMLIKIPATFLSS